MIAEGMMDKIDKYEIIEKIGTGAFATVYKARDVQISGRLVAIKVIHSGLGEGTEGERNVERFIQDGLILSKLKHAGLPTIYALGTTEPPECKPYIVMEYISGQSLRGILNSGAPIGLRKTVDILTQVCAALHDAHMSPDKIIHRDIKPDNILVDENSRAYVVDFGIAHVANSDKTQANVTMGTWPYMSPEQIDPGQMLKGNKEGLDLRTDIFSLGVVLYEIAAGKKPFNVDPNNPTKILYEIVHTAAPEFEPRDKEFNVPGLPGIIAQAMAKDRNERFSSCQEMAGALKSLLPKEEAAKISESTSILVSPPPSRSTSKITGSLRAKKRWPPYAKWIGVSAAAAVMVVAMMLLAKKRAVLFDNLIAITPFEMKTDKTSDALIEFLLERSLTAASLYPVFQETNGRTQDANVERRDPLIHLTGTVTGTVTGFEIELKASLRNKMHSQVFVCAGENDLLSNGIDALVKFLAQETGGDVHSIEGNRTFAQICTGDLDALKEFLIGQAAWAKLDTNARESLSNALERDSGFGLARLKLAEVWLFNEDMKKAAQLIDEALKNKDRLIWTDLIQLEALKARVEAKRSLEQKKSGILAERFSTKKEFLYAYAESYFHSGEADNAIYWYNAALKLDPNYAIAHNHLAFCYSWKGDHETAIKHFRTYIDLDKTANAYDSLATGYMFKGDYESAIQELERIPGTNSIPDYIYGNLATNHIFLGSLARAEEYIKKRSEISRVGTSQADAQAMLAFIAVQRGDLVRADSYLQAARSVYSNDEFTDRLEESPSVPFWLAGVIAAKQNRLDRLQAVIRLFENKVQAHDVKFTNYFPIYKFLIHLRVLEAAMLHKEEAVLAGIEEGRKIREKMGYWTSKFNRAYFMTEFAEILYGVLPANAQVEELLADVQKYNDRYPPAHVLRAKIDIRRGKRAEAAAEIQRARELLGGADPDFGLLASLADMERQIGKR